MILLRMVGELCHVGLVVEPERWMLHCPRGAGVCLERYDAAKWSRRIEGFYRYVA